MRFKQALMNCGRSKEKPITLPIIIIVRWCKCLFMDTHTHTHELNQQQAFTDSPLSSAAFWKNNEKKKVKIGQERTPPTSREVPKNGPTLISLLFGFMLLLAAARCIYEEGE